MSTSDDGSLSEERQEADSDEEVQKQSSSVEEVDSDENVSNKRARRAEFRSSDSDDSDEGKQETRKSPTSDEQSGSEQVAPRNSRSAENSPTQEDLFGDAGDMLTSSEDERKSDHVADVVMSDNEDSDHRREESAAPVEETILHAEIPKIDVDLGNQIHFVKFPNFLSVEPRPFDTDAYEDEIDEDEILDEEGRSRLKLKVENTIRWKTTLDESGNPIRESNAKIIRWSDGSLSLYLGSEVFDVHTHPLQGDHHHLFIRQGTGLQGRNVFKTKLTFRPHSTESFTHRKMTLSMADRTNKAQKVKVLAAVGKNPEAIKQELIKKEEERMRASARRESQQRRMRERSLPGRSLSAGFLEPDRYADEGDESIAAIKNQFKAGAKDYAAGRRRFSGSEEEEEAEEEEVSGSETDELKSKKATSSKRAIDSDDDEDMSGKESDERAVESKRRPANAIHESDDD